MMFDKKEHNESGSGNGGYDAFMSAVKKFLRNIISSARNCWITRFEFRVVDRPMH